MSEQKQQKNGQKNDEMLSAFIDAEQSDIETAQIIDALLNDSEYKEQYIRRQLINDYLHEQTQQSLSCGDLRNNIALALEDFPAHFSDKAVFLQTGRTEDVSRNSWLQLLFKKSVENKMLSGLSVAASVMFVTLFTLQNFNSDLNPQENTELSHSANSDYNAIAHSGQSASIPSLIQSPSALPASFASTASASTDASGQNIKQQYQWIEADPMLSRQVRQYINEHEKRRTAYSLQPKIRTATYQISE